jgi:hypothetical protein
MLNNRHRAISGNLRYVMMAAVLWSVAVPVQAGSISGTFDGDATLTPTGTPGIYTQNFTGDGDDTTYGSFTPTSQSTIDFSNPPHILISDGMLSDAFAGGTLFGTDSGSGTASGTGTATFTIDFAITGGTGIFAGATGEATLAGTITQTSPTTETISNGSYTGSISTSPEPSTLILLAGGLGLWLVGKNRLVARLAILRNRDRDMAGPQT